MVTYNYSNKNDDKENNAQYLIFKDIQINFDLLESEYHNTKAASKFFLDK